MAVLLIVRCDTGPTATRPDRLLYRRKLPRDTLESAVVARLRARLAPYLWEIYAPDSCLTCRVKLLENEVRVPRVRQSPFAGQR